MKEVPIVSDETGLSREYSNLLVGLRMAFDLGDVSAEPGLIGVAEFVNRVGLPLYRERYPEHEYADVVTDANSEGIDSLDAVIGRLRRMNDPATFTEDEFKNAVVEAGRIIYGSSNPITFELSLL